MSAAPKILIVDDDPLLVRLYEKAFTLAKYETDTAFDGNTAAVFSITTTSGEHYIESPKSKE